MAYTDWTFSKSKEFYEKLREHILESDEYEGVVLCDGMEYALSLIHISDNTRHY